MSELPDLLKALLQPSFYDYPVSSTRLMQTHISWVVLTGRYAYKIKKPVRFDFLDYSTLEQRKQFILLELELNRRYSPAIYQGVLPVYQAGAGFAFTGKEENIVEYCLKMREFPQENLFSNLFANHKLDAGRMQQLGKILSELHQKAMIAPEGYGTPEKIRATGEQNYTELLPFAGTLLSAPELERINDWCNQFLKRHNDLFLARLKNGLVVDCHGDLHLNNICLYENEVQIFDCIEFNPEFRFIDRIYDAAFVFMDLVSRASRELAYVFFNTYLTETGDYQGATLLSFYSCYRAMVRAKVYALDSARKEELSDKSRSFLGLAGDFASDKKGKVFIMCGLSGSGKSTIAAYYARTQGALHIRSDAVRKNLAGVPLYARAPESIYTKEMSVATYNRMEEYGINIAVSGLDVVLDAKYDLRRLREHVRSQCLAHGLEFRVLYCDAGIAVVRSRLRQRQGDISDATISLMERQIKEMEKPGADEMSWTVMIDTEKEWQAQVDKLNFI